MTAHVEQVDGHAILIKPVVAETITAEACRRNECPSRAHASFDWLWNQALPIVSSAIKLGAQGVEYCVAFLLRAVGAGVVLNACNQFQRIGKLHQVIVGAACERFSLN